MSLFRPSHLALLSILLPGCALFGDPLLGTWKLSELEEYGPLTTIDTEGETTTTTTLSGVLVLDELDGSRMTGIHTETIQVEVTSPTGTSSDTTEDELEAEARDEGGNEYALDIDGLGDWMCVLRGTELDCEDDDFHSAIFERQAEKGPQ